MNTPTHLLISAGLFAWPDRAVRNVAVLLGALGPDLPIYVLWAQARLRGHAGGPDLVGTVFLRNLADGRDGG